MNAEEFYDWANRPENRDRLYELERGEVVEVSRPGERHGVVCGNVAWFLNGYVRQQRKGYVCVNDTGLILERDPDTVRGPDLMLYLEQRRYDDLNPKYSEQPPTLVVEVLSPNDHFQKVMRRVDRFLARGTRLVWVVDPDSRGVTVCKAGEFPRPLEGDDELVGGDVLPDFRCRVADFFYMPGEEAPAPQG
jgi:Uma2 family endonuclease